MKTGKRAVMMIGAFAALLPFGVIAPQAAIMETTVSVVGAGTPIDWAIDLAVQMRAEGGKLSAADARMMREQMQLQYLSLSPAARQQILAAAQKLTSEEGVQATMKALNNAVHADARQAVADQQAARASAQAAESAQGLQPKFGPLDTDLVFVATVGPCRVWDSRFGPGQLAAGGSTQVYVFSNVAGFNWVTQGGTGIAGSGNCAGTVYPLPVGNYPVSVVATVGTFNSVTSGAMRAWNGGTTLTVGGILGWNAGDVLANTTVIPIDRSIAPFPGSGSKRDIGINNNSGGPVDFVVDVVGYFVHNTATPLECQRILDTDFSLGAGATVLRTAPACPTGFTAMTGMPATNVFGVYTGSFFETQCRLNNTTGATVNNLRCDAMCCRIPGK